jgi:tetratricopeptide (TPR) repeat protein
LDELKRYEEALQNYDRALSLKTNASIVWHNKGITLSKLKRYEQAISAYDKAIKTNDYDSVSLYLLTTADSWYARGLSLFAMKRYQDAMNSFDKAISLRSDFADAIKARSVAQRQLR